MTAFHLISAAPLSEHRCQLTLSACSSIRSLPAGYDQLYLERSGGSQPEKPTFFPEWRCAALSTLIRMMRRRAEIPFLSTGHRLLWRHPLLIASIHRNADRLLQMMQNLPPHPDLRVYSIPEEYLDRLAATLSPRTVPCHLTPSAAGCGINGLALPRRSLYPL